MSGECLVPSAELAKFSASQETINGECVITVAGENLIALLTWLRDSQHFKQLVDVCGADYPAREKRFDVVYQLLDFHGNRRVRVKVQSDAASAVPSASSLFPSAIWFEREVFDMYGAAFSPITVLKAIRSARIFRSPVMSSCVTTKRKNAWCMNRSNCSRRIAASII